jgi:steroid 5-alpha reductase family enzyme
MAGDIARVIAVNAAVIVVLALVLWRVAVRTRDPSFVDVCWGLGFVVVAWVAFALEPHRALLVAITTAWGLRLGGYLFWRWRRNGPDARYVAMLRHAPDPNRFMLTRVFLLQAALLLLVSLPVQLGQMYEGRLRAWNIAGAALAVFGIVFESTGDLQLVRFKADPANTGQVMDRGLWRYTRHPNYFGDFCVWWGIFLVSLANAVTVIGIVGPLVMSFLLMRYSGVGPLERQMQRRKPDYAAYAARTNTFFPGPVKTP